MAIGFIKDLYLFNAFGPVILYREKKKPLPVTPEGDYFNQN
jgi:hypothetical protein